MNGALEINNKPGSDILFGSGMHQPDHIDWDNGGYLESDMPDMMSLIPPPPDKGSAECALDKELNSIYLEADDERKDQAQLDSILQLPAGIDSFNHIIGNAVSLEDTPHLYKILRKTTVDGGRSTGAVKRFYQRPRPFMVNHYPTLTPWDDAMLISDGSYPSGHTAIGWIWALILAELFPDKKAELLIRGYQFGISRMICNVHWHSDVIAGKWCGSIVRYRLASNEEFCSDMIKARNEVLQYSSVNGILT